jgi:hypothetical protein
MSLLLLFNANGQLPEDVFLTVSGSLYKEKYFGLLGAQLSGKLASEENKGILSGTMFKGDLSVVLLTGKLENNGTN